MTPPKPFSRDHYGEITGTKRKGNVGYTTKARMTIIRKDGWKYCYYTGDINELYDLKEDLFEEMNLI